MGVVAFHVTSAHNRESIRRHGLDWRRMLDDPGIAGSVGPEAERIFLARDPGEAEWFVRIGRRHHNAIDVWEVTLLHDFDLEEPPTDSPYEEIDGFLCTREPIPAERLRLVYRDR